MHTIRKTSGLAGFPKRDESTYDAFGVGHSSTSISAGVGMCIDYRTMLKCKNRLSKFRRGLKIQADYG